MELERGVLMEDLGDVSEANEDANEEEDGLKVQ